jgi:nucleotide-binding universal stress UspA family protein
MVDVDDLTDRTAKAAVIQLERLRDQLEREFIHADVVQLTGAPATLIAGQARKLRADFIVMGSHRHSAFHDLLLGSTTSGVIKRSSCPVVIVPPPARPATATSRRTRVDGHKVAPAKSR